MKSEIEVVAGVLIDFRKTTLSTAHLKRNFTDFVEKISQSMGTNFEDESLKKFQNLRILLAKKKPNKPHGGEWEFPGGKVSSNEKFDEALSRELMEELGIETVIGSKIMRTSFRKFEEDLTLAPPSEKMLTSKKEKIIHITAYWVLPLDKKFTMTDHDEFVWLTLEELKNFDISKNDRPIAQKILSIFGL